MKREEIYPANYLMGVLSVYCSIKGNAYPCVPDFCPL